MAHLRAGGGDGRGTRSAWAPVSSGARIRRLVPGGEADQLLDGVERELAQRHARCGRP